MEELLERLNKARNMFVLDGAVGGDMQMRSRDVAVLELFNLVEELVKQHAGLSPQR